MKKTLSVFFLLLMVAFLGSVMVGKQFYPFRH